jgi:hypothetical protein
MHIIFTSEAEKAVFDALQGLEIDETAEVLHVINTTEEGVEYFLMLRTLEQLRKNEEIEGLDSTDESIDDNDENTEETEEDKEVEV